MLTTHHNHFIFVKGSYDFIFKKKLWQFLKQYVHVSITNRYVSEIKHFLFGRFGDFAVKVLWYIRDLQYQYVIRTL